MSIASPPALPRVLATRTVSEAMRAEAFGVRASILAAWRRLTVRPSADAVLHAIVIFRNFNTTVAVVHPSGDMAEVGAVAFADDGIHARGIILGDDRAIRDGFRALAMRLAGDA
jgi:hypothetical protein